jgi:hypothetical protein
MILILSSLSRICPHDPRPAQAAVLEEGRVGDCAGGPRAARARDAGGGIGISHDCSAALLMTLQTISTFTWLSVFYLHREDEVVVVAMMMMARACIFFSKCLGDKLHLNDLIHMHMRVTQLQVQLEGLVAHALLQVARRFCCHSRFPRIIHPRPHA